MGSSDSVWLEILEGLSASVADIERLAGGGTKFARAPGLFRRAIWAYDQLWFRKKYQGLVGCSLRRGNSEPSKLLVRSFLDVARAPGRIQILTNHDVLEARCLQRLDDIVFDALQGGASRVGWCHFDNDPGSLANRCSNNPELYDVDHGEFGVLYASQQLDDRWISGRYHFDPGKERGSVCISAMR